MSNLDDVKKLGTTFYAAVFAAVSAIGGGIWTASELYGQIQGNAEAIEGITQANYESRLVKIEKSLADNDVSKLQGKLAELGTSLTSIMERQKELLDLRDRIASAEKTVAENDIVVKGIDTKFNKINTEIDDLWKGLDAAVSPL
jgi:chromosome segregation ATPase